MVQIACPQDKCAMHISKGERASFLCPVCRECGARSNIIEKDTCVNCWNCWNDEGFIRQGLPEHLYRLKEASESKEKTKKEVIVKI